MSAVAVEHQIAGLPEDQYLEKVIEGLQEKPFDRKALAMHGEKFVRRLSQRISALLKTTKLRLWYRIGQDQYRLSENIPNINGGWVTMWFTGEGDNTVPDFSSVAYKPPEAAVELQDREAALKLYDKLLKGWYARKELGKRTEVLEELCKLIETSSMQLRYCWTADTFTLMPYSDRVDGPSTCLVKNEHLRDALIPQKKGVSQLDWVKIQKEVKEHLIQSQETMIFNAQGVDLPYWLDEVTSIVTATPRSEKTPPAKKQDHSTNPQRGYFQD